MSECLLYLTMMSASIFGRPAILIISHHQYFSMGYSLSMCSGHVIENIWTKNTNILTYSVGCGTIGVAILSGVSESLNSPAKSLQNKVSKWESHTPGTLTPTS